jgi:nucleoside-diphosphate-sugar epimerase
MRVLITGGGGFLGSRLCDRILEIGTLAGPTGAPVTVEHVTLLDTAFRAAHPDPRVSQMSADIADPDAVAAAVGDGPDTSIFHLASMVSGECEERFDDALRVNLDGGRHLFEAARRLPGRARLVFASSIACFGGEGMDPVNTDRTKHTPQTTYGMTKAVLELLLNDHTRKGHFDGRAARLPTVIIRPGKPNAAASSWASGMFREPLAGQPCLLPVRRSQPHPMTSYHTVIDSLILLHDLPSDRLGTDRAYVLPARTVTPELAAAALEKVAADRNLTLGPIEDAFDARIQGIVDNWPTAVDTARGATLGLPAPPPLEKIIEQYLEDYGGNTGA